MKLHPWQTIKSYMKPDLPVERRPDLVGRKQREADREKRDAREGYWWLRPAEQERARQWCRERLARLGK